MFWLTLCGLVILLFFILLSQESHPTSRSVLSKVLRSALTHSFYLIASDLICPFTVNSEELLYRFSNEGVFGNPNSKLWNWSGSNAILN